jgi:hypothetical protein
MKKKMVPCGYVDCGARRKHWEDPFTPRGKQMVEVPEDHTGPVYCSIECACYAGAMSVNVRDKKLCNDFPGKKNE